MNLLISTTEGCTVHALGGESESSPFNDAGSELTHCVCFDVINRRSADVRDYSSLPDVAVLESPLTALSTF